MTAADLKLGEKGIILDASSKHIPLKLIEMGCLPGNEIELIQLAPFSDPLYLNISGSHLAIRRETAVHIFIEKISNE
ncbi:MAG: FeoA family protein [Aureibaculum sp.]